MKNIKLFLILIPFLYYCKKDKCEDCGLTKINPDIIQIAEKYYPSRCAVWFNDNKFYTVGPFKYLQADTNFTLQKDIILAVYGSYYISSNKSSNKILFVQSNYSDVSEGALYEYNTINGQFTKLLDSTENISSAVYFHNSDDSIIYYTYGNPLYTNPGYYLYNKKTKEKRLILSYLAQYILEAEVVNGFDFHPSKNLLLIPAVREGKSPMILEYNIDLEKLDTLNILFDFSFNRICLWLRYNKKGEKVLYSCYPRHAGGRTTNDDSEIGIIDLTSMEKSILDVNTNDGGTFRSVNVFPNWSPDERHIVYGSGKLSMDGARGTYHLYILKNIY